MRYIDTHAHLGPWHEDISTYTPDEFVALQERAGIERSLTPDETPAAPPTAQLRGERRRGRSITVRLS